MPMRMAPMAAPSTIAQAAPALAAEGAMRKIARRIAVILRIMRRSSYNAYAVRVGAEGSVRWCGSRSSKPAAGALRSRLGSIPRALRQVSMKGRRPSFDRGVDVGQIDIAAREREAEIAVLPATDLPEMRKGGGADVTVVVP